MKLKTMALAILINLAALSLIGQNVNKSIIYKGVWEKPYGPIYSKLAYESDSILTYTLVCLIEKEKNTKRFVENTNSRLRFIVKGDSIFSEQDSIKSLVFSPFLFKEKVPTYFIKSSIKSFELNEKSIYIFYPDTLTEIQGELCYKFHLYFISSNEDISNPKIREHMMKKDIVSIDGNFIEYYWYFLPESGLFLFQDSDLLGYEILEGHKFKSLYGKDSFWKKLGHEK